VPAAGRQSRAACRDRWGGAGHERAPARLPLRGALPVRRRPLPCRATAGGVPRRRSLVTLLQGAARRTGIVSALLEVDNLVRHFVLRRSLLGQPLATVKAVDGVSFSVAAGETPALVGGSRGRQPTLSRGLLRSDRGTGEVRGPQRVGVRGR